ncbi:MAG: hypothetical protein D6797_06290 [Bdellovibrio sp.]|nr:MAG: hypothetical protein D6797_06290 [Bdellovibrio sp.]
MKTFYSICFICLMFVATGALGSSSDCQSTLKEDPSPLETQIQTIVSPIKDPYDYIANYTRISFYMKLSQPQVPLQYQFFWESWLKDFQRLESKLRHYFFSESVYEKAVASDFPLHILKAMKKDLEQQLKVIFENFESQNLQNRAKMFFHIIEGNSWITGHLPAAQHEADYFISYHRWSSHVLDPYFRRIIYLSNKMGEGRGFESIKEQTEALKQLLERPKLID